MSDASLRIDLVVESTSGGAGRHVIDLFEELDARGHDVRLVASLARSDEAFRDLVRKIDDRRKVLLPLRRSPHPSDLAALASLQADLRKSPGPRILHAHSTKAGALVAALALGGHPCVFTPHAYRGMDPRLPPGTRRALRIVESMISRRFARVLAVSPEERDYAVGLGMPKHRVALVPNGIDAAAIAARAVAPCLKAPRVPTLGFVGRLCQQKNPLAFIRVVHAARQLRPEVQGLMIGDGEMRSKVQEEIERLSLGNTISVLGYVDFVTHARQIDVLVHTSYYESLPYTLLEACAADVPVVAVRNAGTESIFGTEALGFPKWDDVLGLTNRVMAILSSDDVRRSAIDRSREVVRSFSKSSMVDSIESQYRAVAPVLPRKWSKIAHFLKSEGAVDQRPLGGPI